MTLFLLQNIMITKLFFLDLDSKTLEKTKKGIDLFYEDADFEVYSLDFGE